MQAPLINNPSASRKCLQRDGAVSYPFFPSGLNGLICDINTTFQGLLSHQASLTLNSHLAALAYIFITAMHLEVYRRPSLPKWTTLAFLLAGQVLTAASMLPAFFLLLACYDFGHGKRKALLSRHIWTASISTFVGFVLPTWYCEHSNYDYNVLTVWQFFPLWILGCELVVGTVLRSRAGGSFDRRSFNKAVAATAIAGTGIALRATYGPRQELVSLKDMLETYRSDQDHASQAHYVFVVDMACAMAAMLLYFYLIRQRREVLFLAPLCYLMGVSGATSIALAVVLWQS